MRITITGASGFVGRELVPLLAGHELTLVGREPGRLRSLFPQHRCAGYEVIPERCDLLVHLAGANNRRGESGHTEANVLLTRQLAQATGATRMVFASSIHALDPRSPYARSKAEAEAALADGPVPVTILRLANVHGTRTCGALAWMNALPRPLARLLFPLAVSLRPTLDVRKLAATLTAPLPDGTLLLTDDQSANPAYTWGKRGLDLFGVALLVALAGWALPLIWLAVRLDSRGPGLLWQERVGQNGKPFTCLKFRTMAWGTMTAASHEVSPSAVTRIGRVLRRTKLDELPQIWNILLGQMSFIGPRPCLPTQTELIAERARRGVLRLKPGISGLAQVQGIDMSTPRMLAETDATYGALRGHLLDLRLILRTLRGGGRGDAVKG